VEDGFGSSDTDEEFQPRKMKKSRPLSDEFDDEQRAGSILLPRAPSLKTLSTEANQPETHSLGAPPPGAQMVLLKQLKVLMTKDNLLNVNNKKRKVDKKIVKSFFLS
jgi:hypothetical protein